MKPREIKTLLLLEALDSEGCLSQRELSKKLNISLGLVNTIIKRLIDQGYFKLDTLPKSKVRYALTEKGESEKANLAIRHISYLSSIYIEIKARIQDRLDKLYEEGVRKIALYGADTLSEIACLVQSNNPSQQIIAIIDDKKEGQKVNGIEIFSEDELKELSFDAIVITQTENLLKAKEKIIDIHIPAHKIVSLF
jgi:DNA-binding MarR family transcriptional regulator